MPLIPAILALVLALRFTPGLLPGKKHHLDKTLIAFDHPTPQSPVHILIIPRAGLCGLNTLSPADGLTLAAVLRPAGQLAEKCGCSSTGWQLVANAGAYQEVLVLHFHLVSGCLGYQNPTNTSHGDRYEQYVFTAGQVSEG